METIIWVAIAAVGALALWKFWPRENGLDVNNDGKVNTADVKAGLEVVAAKVENEVKAKVEKVAEKAKKNVAKAADKTAAKVKKNVTKAVDKADKAIKKSGRPKKSA